MSSGAQIVRFFPFEPTSQQQIFCKKIASFLNETDTEKCFVLKGYAGTGKTTSIAALVQALPLFKLKAVLLAPTGRAAKVMSAYSGIKASTIHKKIYRKKSSVATNLAFSIAPNLSQNTVFIVDESSMIADEFNHQSGSSFLKDLINYVYQLSPDGKNKNCFLLFVGDTAQLPPVGSLDSPALNDKYLTHNFALNVTQVELTEVVRQKTKSGILANATMIRKMIHKNTLNDLPKFVTKNYTDIFSMTGERLVEGLEYAYRKFGIENTLVVCRANKSANQYNQYIRSQLLYREENLTGGDQIMVVKNNYFWLPENAEVSFIANGDMAKVVRVRREEERYGFRFAEAHIELLDYPDLGTITCKVLLNTLDSETPNLSFEDSKKLFEAINEDYAHLTNKYERMNAIKADEFYNALQIKYAYAVTCHKAQGGQWDAVFVDQGYLTKEMIDLDFMRWLYTAITRSQKELFLVNFSNTFFKESSF